MEPRDSQQKQEQQQAYAIYVRLQWFLYQLPIDHPAWSHVQQAVVKADRYWRDLTPHQPVLDLDRVVAGIGGQTAWQKTAD